MLDDLDNTLASVSMMSSGTRSSIAATTEAAVKTQSEKGGMSVYNRTGKGPPYSPALPLLVTSVHSKDLRELSDFEQCGVILNKA
jgi:hypothetical protein